jgi:CRP-like cAMP-binding protein
MWHLLHEVCPLRSLMLPFNPRSFLSTAGTGREIVSFHKGQVIFAQGDASDAVFVIQTGSVRLTAKTRVGKETTLDILGGSDLVGKDSIAGVSIRTTSAKALTDCQLLRIDGKVMNSALSEEAGLANLVCAYVLARNLRYQRDLVDQRCNRSEKRLAGGTLATGTFGRS